MEGIWSGLSLQNLGDQLLEGQAYGRHSALDGKQIQRKRAPFGVYMPMYYIVSADHFNGLGASKKCKKGGLLLSIPVDS